jgi:hypothetical protein
MCCSSAAAAGMRSCITSLYDCCCALRACGHNGCSGSGPPPDPQLRALRRPLTHSTRRLGGCWMSRSTEGSPDPLLRSQSQPCSLLVQLSKSLSPPLLDHFFTQTAEAIPQAISRSAERRGCAFMKNSAGRQMRQHGRTPVFLSLKSRLCQSRSHCHRAAPLSRLVITDHGLRLPSIASWPH